MTKILGIDPGSRNVGLCLETEAGPLFFDLKTRSENVLGCLMEVKVEVQKFLRAEMKEKVLVLAMEKQLSVGGSNSALMFAAQAAAAGALAEMELQGELVIECMVSPLPVQLRSYAKRVLGYDISTGRATVASFKDKSGFKGLISQHCVDAYLLVRAAQDVLEGRWAYKLPTKEQVLFPWRILNDSGRGQDTQVAPGP